MPKRKYKIIIKKAGYGEESPLQEKDLVRIDSSELSRDDNHKNKVDAIRGKFKKLSDKFVIKKIDNDMATLVGRGKINKTEEIQVPVKYLKKAESINDTDKKLMSEKQVEEVSRDTNFRAISDGDIKKSLAIVDQRLKKKMPLKYSEIKMIIQAVLSKDRTKAMQEIGSYINKGVQKDMFFKVFGETKFNLPQELGVVEAFLDYKMKNNIAFNSKDIDYLIHIPEMAQDLVNHGFDKNTEKMYGKIDSMLSENPKSAMNDQAKGRYEQLKMSNDARAQAIKDQAAKNAQDLKDQESADKAQMEGWAKDDASKKASEQEKIKNDKRMLKSQGIDPKILDDAFWDLIEKRDKNAFSELVKYNTDIKTLHDAVLQKAPDYEFSDRFNTIMQTNPNKPVEGNEVETLVENGIDNADEILRDPEVLFRNPANDAEKATQDNAKKVFLETFKELKRNGHKFSEDFLNVFNEIIAPDRDRKNQRAEDTKESLTAEGNTLLEHMRGKVPGRDMESDLERVYKDSDRLVEDLISSGKGQEFFNVLEDYIVVPNRDNSMEGNYDNKDGETVDLSDKFKEFVVKLNNAIEGQGNTQSSPQESIQGQV